MANNDAFDAANQRARKLGAILPTVVEAHYDRCIDRVVIRLSSGLELAFPPHDVEGLENGSAAQLSKIEISPSGLGIHFPKLDADVYLPALFEGFLGSRKWMAARLGASGGKSRSRAKRSAARSNGKLGGRPRKLA